MSSVQENQSVVYIHRAPIVDAGKLVQGQIHHYTRMANTFWDRRDMRPEEKGLLGQLLSKGDSWRWNPQYLIATNASGANRIYKILNRLIVLGYLHRDVTRDSHGRCTETVYHVYEFPELNPHIGNPLHENQQVENRDHTNKQDTALTNNQSEEQSTNQPSEPACEDLALEEAPAVGFSLTGEGKDDDPAIEPSGNALVEALRQIAAQKGIEPEQPTKDLSDRLTSAPMTVQGELIGYVLNYHKPIKNFWGLVNWCMDNPASIKGYMAPPAVGVATGQKDAGDPYACIPTPQPAQPNRANLFRDTMLDVLEPEFDSMRLLWDALSPAQVEGSTVRFTYRKPFVAGLLQGYKQRIERIERKLSVQLVFDAEQTVAMGGMD